MNGKKELIVVALGGNALSEPQSNGSYHDHIINISITCEALIPLFKSDNDIVITHGNGPQVGNILIQNDESSEKIPPMPLDVCVAESQGEIGFMLQNILKNTFRKYGIKRDVVTLITQVEVDRNDDAFNKPSKPVGPYYSKQNAKELIKNKGWKMVEIPFKGYRRVVPSPKPIRIVETRIIHQLLLHDQLPIAVGGGGVPVYKDKNGDLKGVEAVIDKDLASSRLAIDLKADKFIIVTNVPYCYLNYGKGTQSKISEMNLDEASTYYEQGQFSSGSMGPKIQAAIEYLTNGGSEVYITDLENTSLALNKESGTYIHH
jgi:carbamate kinase